MAGNKKGIVPFMCSFCHYGLLGGALFFDDKSMTYRTNKVTVEARYRNLKIPYTEIVSFSYMKALPIVSFNMADGEKFSFMIFNLKRFKTVFERIVRIMEMEAVFDRALELFEALPGSAKELLEFQSEIKNLSDYYESPDFKADFEADENGKVPKGIKRGVLSEDGIYDLLENNKGFLHMYQVHM
ncbi:MAG: DUF4298 domain-containing protein [Lachnospiraceae bacterium]|nr:DUF4298 domain-containing protein [Lachnospiraceae bacterium]